jgi:hypothetical protein
MFHLQLRQFPHNHCRFNLTEQQLRSITEPWVRGEWLEIGERRWNANQAKLTIIEGPHIPTEQLSMGRGWRHAERHGHDMTRKVLAAAASSGAGSPHSGIAQEARTAPLGDPSPTPGASARTGAPAAAAGAVRSLLGDGPRAEALLVAWQQTADRYPNRSPSECLALAEEELESQSGGRDR